MAVDKTVIHLRIALVLVVIYFTNGAVAQTTETKTETGLSWIYIIIIAAGGGGVAVIGPVLFCMKAYCLNSESDFYKCKCITGENVVDVEGNYENMTTSQRRAFERMNPSELAKASMVAVDNINRDDWHIPPEKVNLVVEDLLVDMMDDARANEAPREHILFTYELSVKDDVLRFRERLRSERYRVWIDVEKMAKHAGAEAEGMAKAIEGAAVVVPVLTTNYENDNKCKKEIEFADKIKKTLVPVRMQKKYRPGGWLAFLLGNTLFHDLSNENTYQAQIDNFLEALEAVGKNAKIAEDDFDDD